MDKLFSAIIVTYILKIIWKVPKASIIQSGKCLIRIANNLFKFLKSHFNTIFHMWTFDLVYLYHDCQSNLFTQVVTKAISNNHMELSFQKFSRNYLDTVRYFWKLNSKAYLRLDEYTNAQMQNFHRETKRDLRVKLNK